MNAESVRRLIFLQWISPNIIVRACLFLISSSPDMEFEVDQTDELMMSVKR